MFYIFSQICTQYVLSFFHPLTICNPALLYVFTSLQQPFTPLFAPSAGFSICVPRHTHFVFLQTLPLLYFLLVRSPQCVFSLRLFCLTILLLAPMIYIDYNISHTVVSEDDLVKRLIINVTCTVVASDGKPELQLSYNGDAGEQFHFFGEKDEYVNQGNYIFNATIQTTLFVPNYGEIVCNVKDRRGAYSSSTRIRVSSGGECTFHILCTTQGQQWASKSYLILDMFYISNDRIWGSYLCPTPFMPFFHFNSG